MCKLRPSAHSPTLPLDSPTSRIVLVLYQEVQLCAPVAGAFFLATLQGMMDLILTLRAHGDSVGQYLHVTSLEWDMSPRH